MQKGSGSDRLLEAERHAIADALDIDQDEEIVRGVCGFLGWIKIQELIGELGLKIPYQPTRSDGTGFKSNKDGFVVPEVFKQWMPGESYPDCDGKGKCPLYRLHEEEEEL
jgi:hypothetical protein